MPSGRRPRPWRVLGGAVFVALLVASVAGGLLLWHEAETSRLQARELARYAARLDYALLAGPSDGDPLSRATAPSTSASATPSWRASPSACRRAASRSSSRCASMTR